MNKLYFIKHTSVFLLIILLSPLKLISQNQPSEKEIMRSGKYFWGRAVNADTIIAKQESRNELMSQISNKISNAGDLNEKSEIFVKYIKYIYKPVEELTKVIAFVPIENVTSIIENKASLIVTPMKYTEAPTTSETKDKSPIASSIKVSSVVEEKLQEKPLETTNKEDIIKKSGKSLLDRLVDCNTGVELGAILEKEKSNNTLIYSANVEVFKKVNSSSNFYIAIINPSNNSIISFLDKGSSDRKDLKNGGKLINIEHEYVNMVQVWIQLL